jgi:hypothetical protein
MVVRRLGLLEEPATGPYATLYGRSFSRSCILVLNPCTGGMVVLSPVVLDARIPPATRLAASGRRPW